MPSSRRTPDPANRTAPVSCPSCGAAVAANVSLCPACGAALTASSDDPAQDSPGSTGHFEFNWGAFGLTWIWLYAHGEIALAFGVMAVYVVFAVLRTTQPGGWPILLFAQLAISIYFGITGNRIAKRWYGVESEAELRDRQRGWTIAGKIVVALNILILAALLFRT